MEPEPFFRQADNGAWIGHHHPYRDLPELECHIAPPYAVINAGPKCMNLNLARCTRLSWIRDEHFTEGAKTPARALMGHLGTF